MNKCPISIGRNFRLDQTLGLAVNVKNAVGMWGPYDVRDAAPFGPWREFSDQPVRQPGGDRRNADDEREASNPLPVRPIDDRAPEAIGPLENQSKDGS
jgi:hypothetical protein